MNKDISQTINKHMNVKDTWSQSLNAFVAKFRRFEYIHERIKELEEELYSNKEDATLFKLLIKMKHNSKVLQYPTPNTVMNTYRNVKTPVEARFLLEAISRENIPF